MKISEDRKGKVLLLNVSERLDSVTSPDLEKRINELIESGDVNLLINFSNLQYISSAGLRVLLATAKKVKTKDGKLLICCLSGVVEEVFKMSGFNTILSIYDNEEEALKTEKKI